MSAARTKLKGNPQIASWRDQEGWTQVELAVRADVSRRALQKAETGTESVSKQTLRNIADALGREFREVVHPTDVQSSDAFSRWPWSLHEFVRNRISLSTHALGRDADDIRLAVRQMRRDWRDHLEYASQLGDISAATKASERLDEASADYERRYIGIWKRNPSSIMFATAADVRTGLSVVLPVTDEAYARLKKGEISFMDISASDVLSQSQNLILDSAVELRTDAPSPWYRVTDSLSFSIFFQIATQSIDPAANNFRMLGFGGSPLNLKRLHDIGFVEYGVMMPRYDYVMCEFGGGERHAVRGNDSQDPDRMQRAATTSHYAGLFKRFNLSNAKLSMKRSVIRRMLKIYGPLGRRQLESLHRFQVDAAA